MSDTEYKYEECLEALLYTLECTLATVDDLCMKKSAAMSELRRQIKIAQHSIDTLQAIEFLAECRGGRIEKVITHNDRSVMKYAKSVRNRWHPDKPIKEE